MPQTILGIDIGTYSIKILKAERGLGEFFVTDFYEKQVVDSDLLTSDQGISSALNSFFEEHPLSYDTAVASLSGLETAFRVLEFPFHQLSKIDSAIEFELEGYVPFPIEELWVDFEVLEKTPQASKVLAVYTSKKEIVKFLNLLGQAGCDPRYLGVGCIDLAHLYHSRMLPPEGSYMLLDIGHSKTHLCIMEGQRLCMARTLSLGGKTITRAIAKTLNIPIPQAEEMKTKKGQVSAFEIGDTLSETIQKVIDDLLIQIKQTLFAFYEGGGKRIEAVYLSGGTSKLAGLDQFISTSLRVNVSALDVLDYTYSRLSNTDVLRPIIPQCMALIFRALSPSKTVSLNLRRGEFSYKRDFQAISGHFKQLAFLPFMAIILGIIYFIVSYSTFDSREQKMNAEVASVIKQAIPDLQKNKLKDVRSAINVVDGKIKEASEKLKKMDVGRNLSSLETLKLISDNLPPRPEVKLDVDKLTITSDNIRLEGTTLSLDTRNKIVDGLQKVKEFKNIQLGNIRYGVQGELKFSLSIEPGE